MKIVGLAIEQTRLSTAEAELRVTVTADEAVPDAAIAGRLTGPLCPHAETVQLAYPLKMLSGMPLSARIIVDEPNLSTAAMPFRYDGVVELRVGGTVVDRRDFQVFFKSL